MWWDGSSQLPGRLRAVQRDKYSHYFQLYIFSQLILFYFLPFVTLFITVVVVPWQAISLSRRRSLSNYRSILFHSYFIAPTPFGLNFGIVVFKSIFLQQESHEKSPILSFDHYCNLFLWNVPQTPFSIILNNTYSFSLILFLLFTFNACLN